MTAKKGAKTTSFVSYLTWIVVGLAVFVGLVLQVPDPELDWNNFVLPMTNRYVGRTAKEDQSTTPLQGINVVVSGATSGIGKGLVEGFDRLGANVIAMGRNPEKLQQLQQEFASISTVVADFNDLDTVAKAADEINVKFNHTIDILVNNAGIHEGVILLHDPVSKQGYDRIFSVNYLAHLLLTEKLAPSLNKSERPVVAQMSSGFHHVGDWSDLIPTVTGSPPPASLPGGSGGFVFRTQRGYGNSKLALIFMARALKRRNALLQKARIVSICPAWVATHIMPPGTGGHLLIKYLGFHPSGWGIASSLYGIFTEDYPDADFFSNTKAINLPVLPLMKNYEIAHAPWTFAFGLRDFGSFVLAFGVITLQRLMAAVEPCISSPVTYNEKLQDQVYDWSREAIANWL